jgi:hypothetical protein
MTQQSNVVICLGNQLQIFKHDLAIKGNKLPANGTIKPKKSTANTICPFLVLPDILRAYNW